MNTNVFTEAEKSMIEYKLNRILGEGYSFNFVLNKLSFRGRVVPYDQMTFGEMDALEEALN